MDNFPKLRRLTHSSVRILSLLLFLIRFGLSIFMLHRYIIFASIKEVKKGGTFVEAIYEPISYLPYWGDPEKNGFYQTMLFPGCLGEGSGNFCDISTEDNQVYKISPKPGTVWSDGKEFSSDDILFTYNEIIINNKRQQPYLTQYETIKVSTGEQNIITVTFPTKNEQNRSFFSLPILPKHIIAGLNIEQYVQQFSSNPITMGCAKLTTSNDSNSLVIDLTHCDHSNINYYQIKSYTSYQDFVKNTAKSNKNSVSLYQGSTQLSGYRLLPVINNTYMTVFFNTSSENLSPRIQRALGGLIYNNITKENTIEHMSSYTGLFSRQQSDGKNIQEFIASKNPNLNYDKQGLEQAGVKPLPENLTLDGSSVRQSFFFSKVDNGIRKLSITNPTITKSIQGKSDRSNTPLSIVSNRDGKGFTINLAVGSDKQIREGVNTITIEGNQDGQKKTLLTIDIYYLGDSSSKEIGAKTLKVLYYNDAISKNIIEKLSQEFKEYAIQDFFEFEKFDDINLFAAAINTKKYDMVITPLSMTSPIDIAAIITNQDAQKNPSSYQNLQLAKMIEDFVNNGSNSTKRTISDIFSTDMPFVILGQITTPYWIKDDINLAYTGQVNLKELRDTILSQANIVSHMNIRGGKLLEQKTVTNFLQSQKNSF